jgi:serine/threonine-protein kinase RsbW
MKTNSQTNEVGMTRKMAVVLENKREELRTLTQMLQVFLRPYQLPSRAMYALELSLEEVFVNIVAYAYEDDRPHEVHFDVSVDDDMIAMKFSDDGRPFNPLTVRKPDNHDPQKEITMGGLGINFVRQMRDMMEYQRQDDWNILRLWFQRQSDLTASPQAAGPEPGNADNGPTPQGT